MPDEEHACAGHKAKDAKPLRREGMALAPVCTPAWVGEDQGERVPQELPLCGEPA